jgi:hypothetical protein
MNMLKKKKSQENNPFTGPSKIISNNICNQGGERALK